MNDNIVKRSTYCVANNLYNFLVIRNMTVCDLAKKVGVSTASVYYWINGEKLPSLAKLILMANILHVSIDDFVTER